MRVRETSADAIKDVISYRSTVAVAVLFLRATTVVGRAFAADAAVFTLVLQSKVQAVNQTEEVRVTVGCNAVSTGLQEVVRTVGVAAEFRQNVGPGSYVVNNAVVTTYSSGSGRRSSSATRRSIRPPLDNCFRKASSFVKR